VAEPIDPGADVGHIHLRVSDLDRSVAFYRDVLGFEVQQAGRSAAFLSAGGYHHHVALNTWESLGGSPPPPGSTGLFHVAFRYPGRASLAKAVKRVLDHGVTITGASDHGVSEAVYFRDPDDNGVELYYDRAAKDWPRPSDGKGVAMFSEPLDVAALVAEAG
jgi:catechol 2,3-dioxygenase